MDSFPPDNRRLGVADSAQDRVENKAASSREGFTAAAAAAAVVAALELAQAGAPDPLAPILQPVLKIFSPHPHRPLQHGHFARPDQLPQWPLYPFLPPKYLM